MENIKNLPPFKRFCMTIGQLPTSYVESMSYAECIVWLCKYLKETVVPAVNENAEAVNELINWFNNLDVQEEINNKLDEMAESGELEEIISDYLNSTAIFGFDTVADLKEATNLINGSFATTLGYSSVNDGGRAKYKIRTRTYEDVVDEMSIILINEDLVAELVPENGTIYAKQFGAVGDGETDDTDSLKAFFAYNTDKYVINAGTYVIDDNLKPTSNSVIDFEEGAIIQRATNNLSNYYMLWVDGIDNVSINNAHLIGDRETHTGTSGEYGHGINIVHSSNITVDGALIEQTWGDGIYIGFHNTTASDDKPVKNIKILNCHTYKTSRCGIQISSGDNIEVRDCIFEYSDRNSSMVGVNVEAEAQSGVSTSLTNVQLINVKTANNGYAGIQVYLNNTHPTNNILIDGHYALNEYNGFVVGGSGTVPEKESIIYRNASIVLTRNYPFSVKTKSTDCGLLIQDVNVDSCSRESMTDTYGIALIKNLDENHKTGNITFDNITVSNSHGSSIWGRFLRFQNNSEDVGEFEDIYLKNIQVDFQMMMMHVTNVARIDFTKVKATNCQFPYFGTYATINFSGQNYNRLIMPTKNGNSSSTITESIAEGDYEITVRPSGYTYTVTFDSGLTVCTGDGSTAGKTYTSTKACSSIKFTKIGSTIFVTSTVGFA